MYNGDIWMARMTLAKPPANIPSDGSPTLTRALFTTGKLCRDKLTCLYTYI